MDKDEFNGKEYVIFDEGRNYVDVYIPKNGIKDGNRHNNLTYMTLKLIDINSDASYDDLLRMMISINRTHCKPPLDDEKIEKMVEWGWDKKINGLVDIEKKKRYVFFDPDCTLSAKQKQSISAGVSAKRKRIRTMKKIRDGIKELYNDQVKITQVKVAERNGVKVGTIKRYWSEFKEDVRVMNENIRENG